MLIKANCGVAAAESHDSRNNASICVENNNNIKQYPLSAECRHHNQPNHDTIAKLPLAETRCSLSRNCGWRLIDFSTLRNRGFTGNMLHLRIPRERRAPLLRGHGLRMKQIRTMSRGWTKEVLSPGQQREQAEPLGRTVGMN